MACAFQHLNFQECSKNNVPCTFSLGHELRVTTAYNSSSLLFPDGSAPASLASLLLDPPEPQIIGKKSGSRLCYLFCAPTSSFFCLFLFSDLLSSLLWLFPPLLFHLSILSEVWLQNFDQLRMFLRIPMIYSYHTYITDLIIYEHWQACKWIQRRPCVPMILLEMYLWHWGGGATLYVSFYTRCRMWGPIVEHVAYN